MFATTTIPQQMINNHHLRTGRESNIRSVLSCDERCNMSLTEETTNTKHTHKRSEAQWLSDMIHTKLGSKTLINPDCDCGYAIYLNFNDARA